MQICTRSLARVPAHAIGQRKAPFILLEHFRLNRQDFRRGFAWNFRRNKPRVLVLPIVPMDPPVYMSTYQHYIHNPATCPLDLV
jgi:hypothetical protein